jgi:hypoxanthine-guanine phosphoribosyltransferase
MQVLERLSVAPEASWYALRGDHQRQVERYVVSTPQSRAICNSPELLGVDFNLSLHDGMAAAFRTAPFKELIAGHPEPGVCVVNFLRGGLNFEIRRALHSAYGFNRHCSAFMSSQRFRNDEGRWGVKEDMYRKLDIRPGAVLVMGDVVATGVTVKNGLEVILDHLVKLGSSARALVFFTLGCHKAEKVLEDLDAQLRAAFPSYERTILVYLEAKFRLVDSQTPLRVGIPGTDLIRRGAFMTPELESSQYDVPGSMLERCVIYDAGSRAFDIPNYTEDLVEYWEQVAGFARDGWTLAEALDERWPQRLRGPEEAFLALRRKGWRGVDDDEISGLYRQLLDFWAQPAGSRELLELCNARLAALREAGGLEA